MSNNRPWLVALGLLAVAVTCVMAVLAYLLLTLPVPAEELSPTPRRTALSLPTAPIPAATAGLRRPVEVKFIPEEPIKGFSSCNSYGFKGKIMVTAGNQVGDIQVVVWKDEAGGLLALDAVDSKGSYSIAIQGKPSPRDRWVQLYQNDSPISEPVLVKTQVDCQNGFQIYQINWLAVPDGDMK